MEWLMSLRSRSLAAASGLLAATLLVSAGCNQSVSPPTQSQSAESGAHSESTTLSPGTADAVAGEHAHKPGAHGGIIVSIGVDSYHAEAVVEKGGGLRLLMLGQDESRIQEVDSQTLTAYVKVPGDAEATPIELSAVPQEGDGPGQTSQFVGQLPAEVIGRELEVTIPLLRIAGERFRVGFTTASASHADEMPAAASGAEEQALYLTPGGIYTDADIAANGGITAAAKFRGIMAKHDMTPDPGDRICPITHTKANAKFSWIVGGKSYEFCCPPCVDEFVRLAKEEPDAIQTPEAYVKQ
jgi:YHS domain-containing protein